MKQALRALGLLATACLTSGCASGPPPIGTRSTEALLQTLRDRQYRLGLPPTPDEEQEAHAIAALLRQRRLAAEAKALARVIDLAESPVGPKCADATEQIAYLRGLDGGELTLRLRRPREREGVAGPRDRAHEGAPAGRAAPRDRGDVRGPGSGRRRRLRRRERPSRRRLGGEPGSAGRHRAREGEPDQGASVPLRAWDRASWRGCGPVAPPAWPAVHARFAARNQARRRCVAVAPVARRESRSLRAAVNAWRRAHLAEPPALPPTRAGKSVGRAWHMRCNCAAARGARAAEVPRLDRPRARPIGRGRAGETTTGPSMESRMRTFARTILVGAMAVAGLISSAAGNAQAAWLRTPGIECVPSSNDYMSASNAHWSNLSNQYNGNVYRYAYCPIRDSDVMSRTAISMITFHVTDGSTSSSTGALACVEDPYSTSVLCGAYGYAFGSGPYNTVASNNAATGYTSIDLDPSALQSLAAPWWYSAGYIRVSLPPASGGAGVSSGVMQYWMTT